MVTIAIVMEMIRTIATPPIIALETDSSSLVLPPEGGDEVGGEHWGWSREEMETEQWGSRVISTPVTMRLASPPLTHSSIRETRERLSISEVPSSRARYVRNDEDSG